MPDQTPKQPKKLPTYEEALEKLGPDAMSFFSDMVRPDQHEEREDEFREEQSEK